MGKWITEDMEVSKPLWRCVWVTLPDRHVIQAYARLGGWTSVLTGEMLEIVAWQEMDQPEPYSGPIDAGREVEHLKARLDLLKVALNGAFRRRCDVEDCRLIFTAEEMAALKRGLGL